MAKLKYGAIVTDSRGSIGGHTIKWSRYGHVLYPRQFPTKKLTQKNSVARANFSTYSKRWWQTLTSGQRDDWRALAAANPRPNLWGDEFPLTGLALYIGVNRLLVQAGELPTDDAPADQAVTSPATASLSLDSPSTADLTFTPSPVPTDHIGWISASAALSPGIVNVDHKLSFLTATGAAATSPLDVSTELVAALGGIFTGRQYFLELRFFNTSNGALSPGLLASAIAT